MSEISNEPTMEEILSSIKKIISDDSDKGLSPSRPRQPVSREPSHDDVSAAPAFVTEIADEDVFELTEETPDVVVAEAAPALISPSAEAASRSALETLSSAVAKPSVQGGITLDALVREMMTPLLKDWLDANLPSIVEAVVTKEVARISGR